MNKEEQQYSLLLGALVIGLFVGILLLGDGEEGKSTEQRAHHIYQ